MSEWEDDCALCAWFDAAGGDVKCVGTNDGAIARGSTGENQVTFSDFCDAPPDFSLSAAVPDFSLSPVRADFSSSCCCCSASMARIAASDRFAAAAKLTGECSAPEYWAADGSGSGSGSVDGRESVGTAAEEAGRWVAGSERAGLAFEMDAGWADADDETAEDEWWAGVGDANRAANGDGECVRDSLPCDVKMRPRAVCDDDAIRPPRRCVCEFTC